jgi:hypothetical protein
MPRFVKRMCDNGATGYPVTMELGRRAFNLRLAACRLATGCAARAAGDRDERIGKTRAL